MESNDDQSSNPIERMHSKLSLRPVNPGENDEIVFEYSIKAVSHFQSLCRLRQRLSLSARHESEVFLFVRRRSSEQRSYLSFLDSSNQTDITERHSHKRSIELDF